MNITNLNNILDSHKENYTNSYKTVLKKIVTYVIKSDYIVDTINIVNKNNNLNIEILYDNSAKKELYINKFELKNLYEIKIKDICNDLIEFFKDDNLYNYKLQKILIKIQKYLLKNVTSITKKIFSEKIIKNIKLFLAKLLNSDKIKKVFIKLILLFISEINEKYCFKLLNDDIKKQIILSMLPIIIEKGINSIDNIQYFMDIIIKVVEKYLTDIKLEKIFEYKIYIIKLIQLITEILGNFEIKDFILS